MPPPATGSRGGGPPSATDQGGESLLAEIAAGRSGAAFERLFDRYAGRLKHFFVRGGIDGERAEELVQEVLLAVWRRADSFDPGLASAQTWLYTLARNRRTDELRRAANAGPRAEDLAWDCNDTPTPEWMLGRRQRSDALLLAFADLPDEQRFVLERSFYDGQSLSQIAAETGLPLGTVKSRARLALERLRRNLSNDGNS